MRPLIREITDQFDIPEFSDSERQGLPSGAAHIIDAIDRHYGELPDAVVWATALLLVVLARGGTCLPLDRVSSIYESDILPNELRGASVAQWLAHLEPITHRDTGEVEPLRVVNDSLYFDRYLEIERGIARALCSPLDDRAVAMPARFAAVSSEIFATTDSENIPLEAALGVWSHRSFVIAGGPGTGKTTTVAKFLASLELSLSEGEAFPRIRLCAPTGKAAQRMREAIEGAIAGLALDDETATRLLARLEPTTIHSLLGISPTRPRRRNVDFLAADLVICDETSMVDVALLGELLRALSPATRIVLVGDPNQLQSVDAGSAMGDIVAAMRHGDVAGVELTVVRRVSGSNRDVLLQLFDAVRRGSSDEAMALIEAGVTGVSWAPLTSGESNVPQDVLRPVVQRAERLRSLASDPAVRDDDIERELTSVMVLTAQHHGDFGRHWWVRHVADTLGVNTGGSPRDVGVPVLVTQTDRGANLVNGDDGIVRATPEGDLVFDTMGSFPVRLRPAAVTHWQPWYAMTIHKSQGSEFQRVVVSVTPGTRLLSRELLYTALTRAKEEVTIVATPDDLRLAIERPVVRLTGLADALRRAATVI